MPELKRAISTQKKIKVIRAFLFKTTQQCERRVTRVPPEKSWRQKSRGWKIPIFCSVPNVTILKNKEEIELQMARRLALICCPIQESSPVRACQVEEADAQECPFGLHHQVNRLQVRVFVFLTNALSLDALEVAKLYKSR